MASEQSRQYLSALEAGTDRQRVLAEIALGTLDRNILWNQFLAEFGLKRDAIMYQIQNGQVESLFPILSMFSNFVNMSRQGFV